MYGHENGHFSCDHDELFHHADTGDVTCAECGEVLTGEDVLYAVYDRDAKVWREVPRRSREKDLTPRFGEEAIKEALERVMPRSNGIYPFMPLGDKLDTYYERQAPPVPRAEDDEDGSQAGHGSVAAERKAAASNDEEESAEDQDRATGESAAGDPHFSPNTAPERPMGGPLTEAEAGGVYAGAVRHEFEEFDYC